MPRPGLVTLPFSPPASTAQEPTITIVEKVRALDIFAGAGGLSIGLEQAGFEIVAGAEWDPDACETFAKAHPSADVVEGDASAIDFRRWRGEVDVLVGGPPCQPWSTGGKRLGTGDPRDGWPAFLRALREIKPRAFIAENVAGFASGARRHHFEALIGELAALRFRVSAEVLNAADYGVPHKRQRLLIVGVHTDTFNFPGPSFGPGRRQGWRAAETVIGAEPLGTPNPAIVTYARSPDLRPNPYDGHVYNGGGRPIDLNRPAPTLLASMGSLSSAWATPRRPAGGVAASAPVPASTAYATTMRAASR